jgi:3-oxoacyl-[acyl-carrier protein] reductase
MVRELQLFRWLKPMSAEEVAQTLITGLNRQKTEIVVGWQSHLALWCQKFAPKLLEKIVDLASPLRQGKGKRGWREVFN